MKNEHSPNTVNGIRPSILISRCVGFEHCRWNGDIIASPYIEKLKNHIDFATVCPESDIGLGVPRKPLRLVNQGGKTAMIQHTSDLDITADFDEKYLAVQYFFSPYPEALIELSDSGK